MYRRHPDYESDIARAADPDIGGTALEALVDKHHGEISIAEAVAANPSCPVELYRDMCRFGVRTVRDNPRRDRLLSASPGHLAITGNWSDHWRYKAGDTGVRLLFGMFEPLLDKKRPQAWRLGRLLDYASPKAMRDIAALEPIPESVVRLLAADAAAATRRVVARRRGVPLDVFEDLSRDTAMTVRRAVAENPSAPATVIEHLTRDKDVRIRETAARHAACPANIAASFARSADEAREKKAGRIDDLERHELISLALDGETTPDTLERLASHDDPTVRFTAGYHGGCPQTSLLQLARDPVPWVRAAVAFNLVATPDVLAQLDRRERDVQVGLASRTDLDEAWQIALVDELEDRALLTLANLTPHIEVWLAIERRLVDEKKKRAFEGWRKLFINTMVKARKGKAPGNPKIATIEQLFAMRIYARLAAGPRELLALCAHYLHDDYVANPVVVEQHAQGRTLARPKAFARW